MNTYSREEFERDQFGDQPAATHEAPAAELQGEQASGGVLWEGDVEPGELTRVYADRCAAVHSSGTEHPASQQWCALTAAHLATLLRDALARESDAMAVLDPSMPEGGLVDACKQRMTAYLGERDNAVKAIELLAVEKAAHADTKRTLGNLLAVIFRDGGRRQAEIGDDAAGREAERVVREMRAALEETRAAIRKHRDQRGDDRCWLDDGELYAVLPEGAAGADLRLCEPGEMLANCRRFIASRQPGGLPYVSSQRRIEDLEAEVQRQRERRDEWAGGPDMIRGGE